MMRYDKYKDSEVEWIGEIPVEWEAKRLKYLSDVTLGKMLCPEDKGGYLLKPYLKSKNIGRGKVILSTVDEMWFSKSELNSYRLEKDDILLSEGGEVGKAALWNNELDECYIQNSVHRIRIDKRYCNRYFFYYLTHLEGSGFYKSIVSQVSIAHLTKEKLVRIPCIVPNRSEQIRIASYLDNKTYQIDQIIRQKELLLEKLQAKRQAIINETVTKGLNPNVPMAPSGVEWLGDIPEHWELKKGRDTIKFTSGYPFDSSKFENDPELGFPLIRIRNILSGSTDTYYSGEIIESAIVKNEDILIGMDGDYNCAIWKGNKALLNQRVLKVEGTSSLESKYLFYLLPIYLKVINDLTYFTTVKHLSVEELKRITLPIPPKFEQNQIIAHIDTRLIKLDSINCKITDQIRKLKLYSQSLISEVVTGKIKVV